MDTMSYEQFERNSPLRRLDWRWHLAQLHVSRGRHTPHYADPWISRAAAYLCCRDRCRTPEFDELAKFGDVHRACGIAAEGGMTRALIEARLLARQDCGEISRLTGVPSAAISAFHALHFHVKDRLHARFYFTKRAIGRTTLLGDENFDAGTFLKMLGYHGGPQVLNAVIPQLVRSDNRSATTEDTQPADRRTAKWVKLLLSLFRLPATAETHARLLKVVPKLSVAMPSAQVPQRQESVVDVAMEALDGAQWEIPAELLQTRDLVPAVANDEDELLATDDKLVKGHSESPDAAAVSDVAEFADVKGAA